MTLQDDIAKAVDVMRRGGIILYPTDTVWGIGCDATCSEAVRRIFTLKRRADSKAMISLVGSRQMLAAVAGEPDRQVSELLDGDRPTTIIYRHVSGLAPELLAADGSAALRLTREEYSSRLCQALGHPVVSTSANISGEPAAAVYGDISRWIIDGVDYAASYRRDDLKESLPSRIVEIMSDKTIKIIRP